MFAVHITFEEDISVNVALVTMLNNPDTSIVHNTTITNGNVINAKICTGST